VNIKRHASVLGFIAAGALALTACGSDNNTATTGGDRTGAAGNVSAEVECGGKADLTGEGSSAQKGAVDVFIQAFGTKCSSNKFSYTASGSGNGVKNFNGGQVDIGGTDSPLSKDKGEVDAAATRCQGNPAWNLPLVFGPVTVAYKLDGVQSLTVTPELAAKMFNGTVKTWDDPAVAAVNPGVGLPSKPITVIYRGDESGTTDNFQKYLNAAAKAAWGKDAGKKFNGGVGEGKQGSAGVAEAVSATDGAVTYVEWSYAQDKKLGIAKLDSGAGAVELTSESAGKAVNGAKVKGSGNDLVLDLDALYASKEAGAYPLLLATYEVVCSKGYDADTAKAVKAFLTVAATDAQSGLQDAGYVPLPSEFQTKLLDAIKAIS